MPSIKILAVDDNEDALFALERTLSAAGYEVITASSGEDAYRQAEENSDLSLILLDVVMPGGNGYLITEKLKKHPRLRYLPVFLLTAKDSLADIVKGLDHGADGYITKPYYPEELYARIRAALRLRELYRELQTSQETNERLLEELGERFDFSSIVGSSQAMSRVFELVKKISDVDSPVLITGPTGAGKEMIARAIHFHSKRRQNVFYAQNCAALTETLAEAELFGFVKGAFTGALKDKKGVFEAADRGSLFLDEVGELSPAMQAKLLRVLQEGVFIPVGSVQEKRVDVRIIAATNRNLLEMVEKGSFREDLYFRLNVIAIEVPPLSARREDIPELVNHFLRKYAAILGYKTPTLSPEAMEKLTRYSWRGNVRELQNEIERICILGRDESVLGVELLSPRIALSASELATSGKQLKDAVDALEKKLIQETLLRQKGNKSLAAKELGISRSNLIAKVKQYDIDDD